MDSKIENPTGIANFFIENLMACLLCLFALVVSYLASELLRWVYVLFVCVCSFGFTLSLASFGWSQPPGLSLKI
jgi:hypothetical protein